MTDKEMELLYIIRNHDNPKEALNYALLLMFDFLKKPEELQDTSSEHHRESA